jgi:hypothetical protein
MNWQEYIEKIKNGPISITLNPPKREDCDAHGKFLAYFHRNKKYPLKEPTWGYLSVNYIEKNDPNLKPKEGESGYYPLSLICSHWLPVPPNLD